MTQFIKETVTTKNSDVDQNSEKTSKNEASNSQTIEYLVYFVFGVLEILLGFRLFLKLAGANLTSSFVKVIYGLTGLFVTPFEGIFRRLVTSGDQSTLVLEPSTIVALVVYAVLAWGIVKLVRISSGEKQPE
jgi:hypothetical protein